MPSPVTRAAIAGCALIVIGSAAARAQPYDPDGHPPPPPPYDDGFGHRSPPPRPDEDGDRRPPPPDRYAEDFDRPPPRHPRRYRVVEDFHGPHRICRRDVW